MAGNGNINLRGMIQLNQVEDLLSQILNKIQDQETEIMNLKDTIPQYAIAHQVDKNIDDIHKAIRSLHHRMDGVRDASTVRLSDRIVTAGDLSSQNSSRLDDLTKQLELYAIDTSIQSQLIGLTKKYDEILDNIQDTYTPYSLTQSLQRSTAEYISNLQRLEENLSTKIDRSEIRHVEYLYQELERYQEQIALLEKSSKRFESEFQKFEEVNWKEQKLMREEMDRSWKQVEKDSMARDERIRAQCSQIQQEIRSLQSYVDASFLPLTEQLKNLSSMKELDHSLSSLRKRSEVHWTELSELQAEIKTKANTAEVSRGFVRKEVFTEFMRSLGEEVDRKSTLVEMQRQEQDIQAIHQNLATHASQLELALRFVNWFTQRGELYDYNLKVIDKHLHKLASSSVNSSSPSRMPHQRSPPSGGETDDGFSGFSHALERISYLPKYVSRQDSHVATALPPQQLQRR